MAPLDRRRRGRRRLTSSTILTLVVAGVAALILIGGLTRIGQASTQYDRSVNQTYGLAASVVVRQSNETATQFRHLMGSVGSSSLDRLSLQQSLAAITAATAQQAAAAGSLVPPEPSGRVATEVTGALTERAQATALVRTTVERALGGTATSAATEESAMPTAQAVPALASAGTRLEQADARYADARRSLRHAAGHATLPSSAWVQDPGAWTTGSLSDLVATMTAATTLAPSTALELTAVRLDPSVLPPAPPAAGTPGVPAGAEVVPPTDSLTVTVTVENIGDIDQPTARVSASLTPRASSTTVSSGQSFSVDAGASVTVVLPPLRVQPGGTYTLSVVVTPPPAQVDRDGLSLQYAIHVAPGT